MCEESDFDPSVCEPSYSEFEGWYVETNGAAGAAHMPIGNDQHDRVRYVVPPDDNCSYQIELEDAGDWDYDTHLIVQRLSNGNIYLEYRFTGNGTVFTHWLKDAEGNTRIGPVTCPSGNCGPIAGTLIIPGNEGTEQCGCDPSTNSPDPPDGVTSWKGYNLGGDEHIGSSDLDDLVFEKSLLTGATGGNHYSPGIVSETTNDDPLWQQMYLSTSGNGFTMAIPVDNAGTYRVTLYAVHAGGYDKGRQDVALEGQTMVSGWDLGPPLGGIYGTDEPRPLQKTVTVQVNDGTLDVAVTPNPAWINSYPNFKYVMLSAIKIEELE